MWQEDEHFMARALQLAAFGRPTVSPNPMVGCVIVHDEKIIGEGWHQKAGEPHAEVLAIQSVADEALLKQATVYVTLEPCAHFGQTPPCADLLVRKQVKRVVVGCRDPNPLVGGKGIEKLKAANIEVSVGVLEQQCLQMNKAFFTSISKKRPFIVLKWAQTADGFIARKNFDAKWISSVLSRQLVHKWRSELDAILVGKNTVQYDNPRLNTREWPGKDPVRLIIDHSLQLTPDLNIFDQSIPTFIFNIKKQEEKGNLFWVKLSEADFINQLLEFIHQRKMQSVLVEGGAQTLKQFIELGLWDEARIFTCKAIFEDGVKAPELKNSTLVSQETIEGDLLKIYENSLSISSKKV